MLQERKCQISKEDADANEKSKKNSFIYYSNSQGQNIHLNCESTNVCS